MRILVACALDPLALDHLSRRHEVECCRHLCAGELTDRIRAQEALVLRSDVAVTRALLDAAPELRLIVRAGSGVDNIDLAEVHRRDIRLSRIPGPGAQAAAELSFGLMLALARRIPVLDGLLRRGRWARHDFEGVLLSGRTLGVVGVGNVGRRVGQMGAAWGMSVLGCVGHPSPETSAALRRLGIEHASFEEVVRRADFLSLHLPLKKATERLIDAEVLAQVKPGSFLVNTSRAGVVDEHALYQSLRSGERLRGAALDVHDPAGSGCLSRLRHLPNVVLTPQVGASTLESQRAIGAEVVRILDGFAAEVRAPAPAPALAALGA